MGAVMDRARDLCQYAHASPSPFHAVAETSRRLEAAGFKALDLALPWELEPTRGYYVRRADASVVAFRLGRRSPVEAGFRVAGAHTDSPTLRLKPDPTAGREGYAQLGVEVYGGALLHTWLDRDLGLAGRLVLDTPEGLAGRLVRLDEPLCRVPSLAIHLDREVNDRGLVLNRQGHLPPIFALGDPEPATRALWERLTAQVGASPEALRGFDLGLYDLTEPAVGGLDGAFVFSARLDNLGSCHAATAALAEAAGTFAHTAAIALFDHEEIGSQSGHGAAGPFLREVLGRVLESLGDSGPSAFSRAMAQSFCVSADMAHAVHPNFTDKHEPRHLPRMNKGPVLKSNTQQRYASDGMVAGRLRALAREAGVPLQDFVTRTDLACGTTIGPITAASLGMPTVDVGNPMLSMHSARECAGAQDVAPMVSLLRALFELGRV
jgi:aspartyl aminopeptidase